MKSFLNDTLVVQVAFQTIEKIESARHRPDKQTLRSMGRAFHIDISYFEKPTPEQLEALRREGWLKPGAPVWYNAGIYIFTPLLFEFTARLHKSPRGEYELTDAVNGLLAAGHKLAGLEIEGRWVDVRDPEVLAALERQSEE